MINRFIILLFTILYISTSLFAEVVDLSQARQIATKFYNQKHLITHPGPTETFYPTESHFIKDKGELVLYIFNFNDNGFVIVSADDNIYPVLGFSFEGVYIPEFVPDNAQFVIDEFSRQVSFIRDHYTAASDIVKAAWNNLRSENPEKLSFLTNNRDIDPMVLALWHQNSPYNMFCPEDPDGPGGHVVAGCVSTAMSMLMYHWRYPGQGTGSHSYMAWGYGLQSVNFGETDYDYYGMVNSSDDTFNEMISLLMYHCGVSVEMNYSPNSSGASSSNVAPAIKDYFNYSNNAQIIDRGDLEQWKINLNQQMVLQQPVYYRGCDGEGCHAFVVDGMQEQTDETYYHFNFGWSGNSNGWYLVTDAGGYNQDNRMIKNFVPDPNFYPYNPPQEEVLLTWLNGTIEDCSGPKHDYQNNVDCNWLISPQTEQDSVTNITLTFNRFETEVVNDAVRIYDGPDTNSPMLAQYSGGNMPSAVTSTGNQMLVTFTTNSSETANGWLATYHANTPEWCNGLQTYTGLSGSFGDGSGTFFYQNNTACMYRILPDIPGATTLFFNQLETQDSVDIVKVFDLDTQELLAEISGNQPPGPIASQSGKVFITFTSDESERGQGWELSWSAGNVGYEDISGFQDLNIYPNPAKDILTINFKTIDSDEVSISIQTISGVKILSRQITFVDKLYRHTFDVSELSKGIYLLNIESENGSMVRKLIIE